MRALNGIRVTAEAFAADQQDAKRAAEKANTFINVFHSAQATSIAHGSDPDVKQFFASLKVEQSGDRALLTATAPIAFIRKALAASAEDVTPGGQGEVKQDNQAPQATSK